MTTKNRALVAVASTVLVAGCGPEETWVETCWDATFAYLGDQPLDDATLFVKLTCEDDNFGDWQQGGTATVFVNQDWPSTQCSAEIGVPGQTYSCTAAAWIDIDGDTFEACWDELPDCVPGVQDPFDEIDVSYELGSTLKTDFVFRDP